MKEMHRVLTFVMDEAQKTWFKFFLLKHTTVL